MKLSIAALLPLALAACAASEPLTDVGLLTAPANSVETAAPPLTPSLFAGFTARAVTEPGDWRAVNDSQSPAGGGN